MNMKIFRADQLKTVEGKYRICKSQGNELNFSKLPTQIRTFPTQEPARVHPFLFIILGKMHYVKTFHEIKVNRFHHFKKPVKQKCYWCSTSKFLSPF